MTPNGVPPSPSRTSPRSRLAAPLVCALFVVFSLVQRPGSTTFDTKLDLVIDPGRFLVSATHAWTPGVNLGSLQNQASGYLFPMGPFFLVGDLVGVPPWIWQRLWSALVLIAAFEGMRRLARAWLSSAPQLSAGPWLPSVAWLWVLAGLTYAFSPRILTTVGVLTGETLPGAVLPWTVLPLVLAARGRMRWGWALLLSAATVPFMGGQNATEVLAVLPLPALVVLLAGHGRPRYVRTAQWSVLVILATAWWVGPLLVLGRYAPPFLDFIESASVTTRGVGWLEALRGVTHWVAYLPVAASNWQAGHDLVYLPLLALATTLVALLGLVGLTGRGVPDRAVLILSLVLGLVVVTLGHGGPAGAPLADEFRTFLDGAGAPFRNVHKADPLIRIPLAIGFALAVPAVARWAVVLLRSGSELLSAPPPTRAVRRRWAKGAAACAVMTLMASGLPMVTGDLRADDGWRRIPVAWQSMAVTLRSLPEGSRVLVVPAAGSVAHVWGRTVDEPIQTVEGVAWVSRSQIPLIPVGGLRLVDGIETRIATGQPSDALAQLLLRVGVSHVLLRTDLAPTPGEPAPDRAFAVLEQSPGFGRVATHGRGPRMMPQLALYAVGGAKPPVSAVALAETRVLSGSSEDLLSMLDAGVTTPGERFVAPTSPQRLAAASSMVTDSPKRRERAFGRLHDATSEVLAAGAPWTAERAAHDFLPVPGKDPAVLSHHEVRAIRTSSSASSIQSLGPLRPDEQPWAALDDDLTTHWASAPFTSPVGQWWEVAFATPRRLGDVAFAMDPLGAAVMRVRVSTDRGTEDVSVGRDGIAQPRTLKGTLSRVLRVTVLSAAPGYTTQVRLAEVLGTGFLGPRSVVLPTRIGADDTVHLTADAGRRTCIRSGRGATCEPGAARTPEEANGPRRVFELAEEGRWTVSARATATGGPAVDALLQPLGGGVRARASSVIGSDPLVWAGAAVDADPGTAWVAAAGDPAPSLTLSWGTPRPLTTVSLTKGEGVFGGLPDVRSVEVDGREVLTEVRGSLVRFTEPTVGSTLTLHFEPSSRSFGVAEVGLPGVEDLKVRQNVGALSGAPCGLGPDIVINGLTITTRISGTVADILSGREVDVEPCDEPVQLTAGHVDVAVRPVAGFAVQSLTLAPSSRTTAPDPSPDPTVTRWEETHRVLDLADGPTTLLTVTENSNEGWVAESGGQRLQPILVDGWAQGWIVPAGTQRRVELRFVPDTFFRGTLMTGLVVMSLLVLAAGVGLVPAMRGVVVPQVSTPSVRTRWWHTGAPAWTARGGVLLAAGLVCGPVWAVAAVAGATTPRRYTSAVRAVVILLVLLAGGWRIMEAGPAGWRPVPDLAVAVAVGLAVGHSVRILARPQERRGAA